MSITEFVHDAARRARVAAQELRNAYDGDKNAALHAIADALSANAQTIIDANRRDYEREKANGMSSGLLDRLLLDKGRIDDIATAVRDICALKDPVGDIIDGYRLPNGLQVYRKRVPMGVVGMIYEARPNVTVDAATLCIKSGNAAILRGGSAALETNTVIVDVMRQALADSGLSPDCVQSCDAYGREGARAMMEARGLIDVIIPRGGAGLINSVVEHAKVPVIETGVGNCHIYVDASADGDQAYDIVLNAKTQRVGVCNAAETLLIDRNLADDNAIRLLQGLADAGVRLHADEATRTLAMISGIDDVVPASRADWETEYLSMDIAVAMVDGVGGAINHIRRYSTGHTEACIAQDATVLSRFATSIDSAAIALNASTRFTDGGQLGLGAEIGISTQKLHARGPMGLEALTSTTWVIEGQGHIRH